VVQTMASGGGYWLREPEERAPNCNQAWAKLISTYGQCGQAHGRRAVQRSPSPTRETSALSIPSGSSNQFFDFLKPPIS